MLPPETALSRIAGVSQYFLGRLKALGIETVRDLVWHFPVRYEDFSVVRPIADLAPGEQVTVQGTVRSVSTRRSWHRQGLTITEAVIDDETGSVGALWFNQSYVRNALHPGLRANFSGKITDRDGVLALSNPTYEPIGERETRHTARLVPIYPETRGLTSKGLRFLVQPVLRNLDPIPEWIPEDVLRANRFPDVNAALRAIHFPEVLEDAFAARRRFAFESLFLLQLTNLQEKLRLAKEHAPVIAIAIPRLKEIAASLPFPLTLSQKKSLWEIVKDMGTGQPMNRLLQGDVGSGKTAVAAVAALLAAEAGYQTTFMAPTEVLARQHFATLTKLFAGMAHAGPPAVGLLVGKEAVVRYDDGLEEKMGKERFRRLAAEGRIAVVVGTHALIEKTVTFKKVGLVIIDEQHRFGVAQRAALGGSRGKERRRARSSPAAIPHFLSMSATPIPRTLMLTMFGDLDISTITELPAGRQAIATAIVPPAGRAGAYALVRQEIKSGRQAFVVCPRIDPGTGDALASRQLELRSVKEEYEKLAGKIFPDLRVAMLHGQMKPKEKEKVMNGFRSGAIDVLVATSVIEVGVDIPNATVMMIEGSDRFGLAQLYQLRGRVGRGAHASHCLLFTDSASAKTAERLGAIQKAKSGFELAEYDLKLRGPGEFIGEKQTGMPDVLMNGLTDIDLAKASRTSAARVIQFDPLLTGHPALALALQAFRTRVHGE